MYMYMYINIYLHYVLHLRMLVYGSDAIIIHCSIDESPGNIANSNSSSNNAAMLRKYCNELICLPDSGFSVALRLIQTGLKCS